MMKCHHHMWLILAKRFPGIRTLISSGVQLRLSISPDRGMRLILHPAALFSIIFSEAVCRHSALWSAHRLSDDVGGWNEDLFVWNDFELGARLLLASDRIFHLPGKPSVIVHQQADSITGVSFSSKAGQWEKRLTAWNGISLLPAGLI